MLQPHGILRPYLHGHQNAGHNSCCEKMKQAGDLEFSTVNGEVFDSAH